MYATPERLVNKPRLPEFELNYDLMFMNLLKINELIHVYDQHQFICKIAGLVAVTQRPSLL